MSPHTNILVEGFQRENCRQLVALNSSPAHLVQFALEFAAEKLVFFNDNGTCIFLHFWKKYNDKIKSKVSKWGGMHQSWFLDMYDESFYFFWSGTNQLVSWFWNLYLLNFMPETSKVRLLLSCCWGMTKASFLVFEVGQIRFFKGICCLDLQNMRCCCCQKRIMKLLKSYSRKRNPAAKTIYIQMYYILLKNRFV